VGRAHEDADGLVLKVYVFNVLSLAAGETMVFNAGYRLADAKFFHGVLPVLPESKLT
jgi:hypothetical protein